jgi:acetyl esterase/lipase
MRVASVVFTFIFFFVSCKKKDIIPQDQNSPQTIRNVSYGSDPQQKMDVYLPGGRSVDSTKLMVLIHGGGWNTGDKSDFDIFVDTLKKRDPSYAIFNINYRLANPPNLFPLQELDVKAAIEFIVTKSTEYNISNKIVLVGASAGAHLALLQAYKYPSPVKVKAVVDFFAPTELVSLYTNPPNPLVPALLQSVTGHTPSSNPAIYQESSPVNFVTPQSPPTIILQGGLDIVVSPSQSVLLKNELLVKGVAFEYILYPTEGHGWFGANLTDSFDRILAFLAVHVN